MLSLRRLLSSQAQKKCPLCGSEVLRRSPEGQQRLATQTLRVHLLGIEKRPVQTRRFALKLLGVSLLGSASTILTKIFTDRPKILGFFLDVGNFYRCRLQIPQNFGLVSLANLPTRVPSCLLNNAKAPVGMTDLKSKGILGALVIFTVADFKFWRICLVNISAGMVKRAVPWNMGLVPCANSFVANA